MSKLLLVLVLVLEAPDKNNVQSLGKHVQGDLLRFGFSCSNAALMVHCGCGSAALTDSKCDAELEIGVFLLEVGTR